MKNKKIYILPACLLIFNCSATNQSNLPSLSSTADDSTLAGLIATNSLSKLSEPSAENSQLVLLGETLFSDVSLSGNKDTSCLSCHNLSKGTSDGLPFSIGTGASVVGSARLQINGKSLTTSRNAPALYNLGRTNQIRAFLDGRVSFVNKVISSSVSEISGANPSRSDIASLFTNAFDVQPLFPLLSATEMLGTNNDLSAHTSDVSIWQSILSDRLLTQPIYVDLFNKAFPTTTTSNLNPGHVGRALGAFMKIKFKSNNTPFDQYLSGDLQALSESQKRGMILFYTKAQCFQCHSGSNFSDELFHSSGAPQIGVFPFVDDIGRSGETNLTADLYKFKTPSLRNISLSAPYMHDGAFETLEAVVNHYNNVTSSLNNYTLPSSYQSHYQLTLIVDTNASRNQTRLNQIDNRAIRNGLNLTTQEKTNLVDFLRNGLRDNLFN